MSHAQRAIVKIIYENIKSPLGDKHDTEEVLNLQIAQAEHLNEISELKA